MAEVLVGRLAWAPESDGSLPAGHSVAGSQAIPALSLCEDSSGRRKVDTGGTYSVPHYVPASTGRAFGPLALDQLLRFCHNLDEQLADGKKVCLYTQPDNEADHSNAAVMLGAYLVLKCDWSIQHCSGVLGAAEAGRRFVCSFAPSSRPEPMRNMRVGDCWEGVALAKKMGWIDVACVSSRLEVERACITHRRMADSMDAAWLIPGRVMVSADPVTTANDPNPATFASVFPTALDLEAQGAGIFLPAREASKSTASTATPGSQRGDDELVTPRALETITPHSSSGSLPPAGSFEPTSPMTCGSDASSVPRSKAQDHEWPVSPQRCNNFIHFLQDNGVGLIMRTNAMQERGMIEPSYDKRKLEEWNISHVDITLEDGGCPSKRDVQRALEGGADFKEKGGHGVLVHCKGGFGRSVVMACCLIIDTFDVSGAALLGWVRIARPGAINTPRQERFLQGLRGRTDLARFADSVQVSCGTQCSVQ